MFVTITLGFLQMDITVLHVLISLKDVLRVMLMIQEMPQSVMLVLEAQP